MNGFYMTYSFPPKNVEFDAMSFSYFPRFCQLLLALAALLLTACAILPDSDMDGDKVPADSPFGLMGYFQQIQRMSPQALAREGERLASISRTPAAQIRLAMVFGQTHAPGDLNRALGLLQGLTKSNAPELLKLRPLVQLLSAQYHERAKAMSQNEKLAQQLRESQQQNEKLQEKLRAIAAIENSLQLRPRHGRPVSGQVK